MEPIKAGKWTITFNPKPIPDRRFDYDVVHEDYDVDSDLCFAAGSIDEAIEEIKSRQDDNA